MSPSRRSFLAASFGAFGLTAFGKVAAGNFSPLDDPPPWLTYALDIETFQAKTPLLDRLKLVADTGFKLFEFGRFKTKDFLAMGKVSKELDLTPIRFQVFTGITDPKRKESFLESLSDALEVAELLGSKQLVIGPGELIKGPKPERQVDTVIETLEAALDKIKEVEVVLLLDPLVRKGDSKLRVTPSLKAAAEIVNELNDPKMKLLIDFESGWTIDEKFIAELREHAKAVGAFRLNDLRLKEASKTAGLDPLGLFKLIHEVNATSPLGIEFSPKLDPAATLSRIQELEKQAKG